MICIVCTNCRARLEMDDAFAGGVCRCQHCGTIQTVPSRLAGGGVDPKKSSKTLYKRPATTEAMPSSGLDELAQVVSSGLASAHRAAPARRFSRTQIIIAAVITGLLLSIGAALIMLRSPAPPPAVANAPARPVVSPAFCELPLSGNSIVYVLDRGSATSESFGFLKEATLRSIETLGGDRRFQIIFWNNGGADDAFPSGAPIYATPAAIEAARRAIDPIDARGQTDAASALALAVKSEPDAIVLVTAKGWQLDDTFVDQALRARGEKPIRIDTISLASAQPSPALIKIAEKTGGEFKDVSDELLKRTSRK